jgi:hypothetical protein
VSLRPGAAIRRYLAGQRVAYYAPHKYLFFIGAVTSFLTSRYHSFSSEYTSVVRSTGTPILSRGRFLPTPIPTPR